MKDKKAFLILCFLFPGMFSWGQVNVIKVVPEVSMAGKNGIFYYLPQTVIRVDVIVNKIERQRGPYAAYASELLGFENVINQYKTEYEISEVRLSSFAQPNPDELYFIDFMTPKSTKQKQILHLFISPSGMLQGVSNASAEISQNNLRVDFKGNNTSPDLPGIIIPGTYQKIDTIVRQIRKDTLVIEQKEFNKVTLSKTQEQKAHEIADNIIQLDKDINNLISGYQEINYSKDAMELMLTRMEKQRKSYIELFAGIIQSSKLNYSFTLVPGKEDAGKSLLLAKFSPSQGLSNKEGTGDPFQVILTPINSTRNLKPTNSGYSASGIKGLVYQLPEITGVLVKLGDKKITESSIQVCQFGASASLPDSFSGNLFFYPETGGIKELELK